MKMYIVKMMSKDKIDITEEEYQKIIASKASGLIFIERLKGSINLNSVESILPEELITGEMTEGYLHDGTRVVKQFGIWVDASNPDVKLDRSYYPELAEDRIFSKKEMEKIKGIKRQDLIYYLYSGKLPEENKLLDNNK